MSEAIPRNGLRGDDHRAVKRHRVHCRECGTWLYELDAAEQYVIDNNGDMLVSAEPEPWRSGSPRVNHGQGPSALPQVLHRVARHRGTANARPSCCRRAYILRALDNDG